MYLFPQTVWLHFGIIYIRSELHIFFNQFTLSKAIRPKRLLAVKENEKASRYSRSKDREGTEPS